MKDKDGFSVFFFFQAEDGIRDRLVTGVQTCALPISSNRTLPWRAGASPMMLLSAVVFPAPFRPRRATTDRKSVV
mgnify:CR=1 FL=1